MGSVHATAILDPRAEVPSDAEVGPYAIIEAGVVLGSSCVVHAHAVLRGPTVLGVRNVVHPFAVIGGLAQAKRHEGGPGRLVVGDGNVFREHVTVHGGTGETTTRIGSDNLLMVGVHVAHDAAIGSHCVISNAVQLAGHVEVADWVTFGGQSGAAQHVRIGESAFVAAASACERDVPPFVVVQGDRARVRAVNVVGLRRRGIAETSIRALERAVRSLWLTHTTRAEALQSLAQVQDPFVRELVASLMPR